MNFRVEINDSYDDESLKPTPMLPVLRPSSPRAPATSQSSVQAVAIRRFKGRDLKFMHLNAVNQEWEGANEGSDEEKVGKMNEDDKASALASMGTSPALDRKKARAHRHHHWDHHLQAHYDTFNRSHSREQQKQYDSEPTNQKALQWDSGSSLVEKGGDRLKKASALSLPQGTKTTKSSKLTERVQDSRLKGADFVCCAALPTDQQTAKQCRPSRKNYSEVNDHESKVFPRS